MNCVHKVGVSLYILLQMITSQSYLNKHGAKYQNITMISYKINIFYSYNNNMMTYFSDTPTK